MRLDRAIAKFAKNEIWGWNHGRQCFELTGKKGSLQVYDRFISDRTFGTKKRILLLPRQDYVPSQYDYIRIGDSVARFMMDSLNEDVYSNGPYANTYLLREAKYRVEIGSFRGEQRASGFGGKKEFVVDVEVFGDYERYTGTNSTEFNTVDYTVSDIFLPLSVDIDSTKVLRIDGKMYEVSEVARVSNLLWVRGQKLAEDNLVTVKQGRMYECDLANRWDKVDQAFSVEAVPFPLQFSRPCQSLMLEITDGVNSTGMIGLLGFGAVITGMDCEMALYDASNNLLARSDSNSLQYDQALSRPCYLAVVPSYFEESGTASVTLALPPAP